MSHDWKGNANSIFKTLGASAHTKEQRADLDFYATDPATIDPLLAAVQFPHRIWEPCCGQGHLSKRLAEHGHHVYSSDIADRGFGDVADFFSFDRMPDGCEAIITNPPYSTATDVILHALRLLPEGGICAMFLKTQALEGADRHRRLFSSHPPCLVLQFVKRVRCAKNGEFERMRKGGGSAVAYCWVVWQKGFYSDTVIKWI